MEELGILANIIYIVTNYSYINVSKDFIFILVYMQKKTKGCIFNV